MITLIYASTASKEMTSEELLEILTSAEENNRKLGITGMLLYKNRNFLQVLEGEKEIVEPLYERIKADSRHTGVLTIMVREIPERVFGDWKMGFVNLDTLDEKDLPEGFSDYLLQPIDYAAFEEKPTYAYTFLKNFKDLM